MIIYPLPAQELDDVTLSKQIRNIAQVLCNAHYLQAVYTPLQDNQTLSDLTSDIPLPLKNNDEGLSVSHDKYSKWVHECRANYLKLVEMGLACCEEYHYRFSHNCEDNLNAGMEECDCRIISKAYEWKYHKLQRVIEWCKLNMPNWAASFNRCEGCDASVEPIGSWCTICDNKGFIDEKTPFPICVPDKYIAMYHWHPEDKRDDAPDSITQSYRNYYRAKIKKWIEKTNTCKNCGGIATNCIITSGKYDTSAKCLKCGLNLEKQPVTPKFTRRAKPESLEI